MGLGDQQVMAVAATCCWGDTTAWTAGHPVAYMGAELSGMASLAFGETVSNEAKWPEREDQPHTSPYPARVTCREGNGVAPTSRGSFSRASFTRS